MTNVEGEVLVFAITMANQPGQHQARRHHLDVSGLDINDQIVNDPNYNGNGSAAGLANMRQHPQKRRGKASDYGYNHETEPSRLVRDDDLAQFMEVDEDDDLPHELEQLETMWPEPGVIIYICEPDHHLDKKVMVVFRKCYLKFQCLTFCSASWQYPRREHLRVYEEAQARATAGRRPQQTLEVRMDPGLTLRDNLWINVDEPAIVDPYVTATILGRVTPASLLSLASFMKQHFCGKVYEAIEQPHQASTTGDSPLRSYTGQPSASISPSQIGSTRRESKTWGGTSVKPSKKRDRTREL